MPLDEAAPMHPQAAQAIKEASLIIAESRKVTFPHLKRMGLETNDLNIFFLDPPRKEVWQAVKDQLNEMANKGGTAVLFSDAGMPILFDPGKEVLAHCQQKQFQIHSVTGPTSWGTACALSGFAPPFYLQGFLPREKRERSFTLKRLASLNTNVVLIQWNLLENRLKINLQNHGNSCFLSFQ